MALSGSHNYDILKNKQLFQWRVKRTGLASGNKQWTHPRVWKCNLEMWFKCGWGLILA